MSPNAAEIWSGAQQLLRRKLSEETFKFWFASIKPRGLEADQLILEVEDDFWAIWLQDNYMDLLQQAGTQAAGQPIKIKFHVAVTATAPKVGPETEAGHPQRRDEAERAGGLGQAMFNPRNTFDNFVTGPNNRFAHAAALAVAQNPGKAYNPLFISSGVGLGKTHLLHAIGQHVVQHKRGARVCYLSCEQFTNDFIEAIQNNHLPRFRKKYRQTDVLLMDDIYFLSGKERIQEEFFHTFNCLYEAHKQIVLTCDRPATEIQNLEQRLVSRFDWGMTVDIQPPDMETRLAILRHKASLMKADVPPDILAFLAQRIRSNVRSLEGALVRVTAYQGLLGAKPTLEAVERLLQPLLQQEGRKNITIQQIQKVVADFFDIRLADMTSKRRPEHIAFPRQIAMYLARILTDSSLSTIGEAFGGRDHGTVLHACRTVKDRMSVDPEERRKVEQLERKLVG